MSIIGLGNPAAQLNVYIENTPPLESYLSLSACRPMQNGEIKMIADLTGNHWRKIFNVYAKLVFELKKPHYKSWQDYRDNALLQGHSNENLLFKVTAPEILPHLMRHNTSPNNISIIMGKTYASKLELAETCQWLSTEFAINTDKNLIICPYFDYRQLSNIKITKLCQLIKSMQNVKT